MRAISIWQPWASLIAMGAKGFETRSWATSYRGPLAIHAAKYLPKADLAALPARIVDEILLALSGRDWETLPRGCIIATAELREIFRTGWLLEHGDLSLHEKLLGDYTPGRFAWRLDDMRPIDGPLHLRGYQGLWELGPAAALAVEERARIRQ